MVLGVDFDNTIVCYDPLFHQLAVERGLIPRQVPPRKNAVRDFLRQQGREADWTELQGCVYGARMVEAPPFPGVLDFFIRGRRQGLPLFILSHKTRLPAAGPAYDLHQTALAWLTAQGFFDPARGGLSPDRVRFGATRPEKIGLIRAAGCTHFIDDLPETFLEETFPPHVGKILFGQHPSPPILSPVKVMENWSQITAYVFPAGK